MTGQRRQLIGHRRGRIVDPGQPPIAAALLPTAGPATVPADCAADMMPLASARRSGCVLFVEWMKSDDDKQHGKVRADFVVRSSALEPEPSLSSGVLRQNELIFSVSPSVRDSDSWMSTGLILAPKNETVISARP